MRHRQPNTTAKDMLASGQWARDGKNYIHASGQTIQRQGDYWVVDGCRYDALWLARMIVERKEMTNAE